ncbi:stage II sporulation protein D [Paenibacillus tarimensis]
MKLPGAKLWWAAFAFGITIIVMMYPAEEAENHRQSPHEVILPYESGDPWEEEIDEISGVPAGAAGPESPDSRDEQDRTAADRQGGQMTAFRSPLDSLFINVYIAEEKRSERIPLEVYVRGVVAGEMPANFELEALKAQAIAARTYVYKLLSQPQEKEASAMFGDVSNTVEHQVYIPLKQLLSRWPDGEKQIYLELLNRAVEETRGQIITYEGEPIEALFFSTSNGYTENAEDYWGQAVPYLRSVESPWDAKLSPRYSSTVKMKLSDFYHKLEVKKGSEKSMRVLERTEGRRIKSISVGGKTFSGREIRERLELMSSHFIWRVQGKEIIFTTYGFGHGVGMSQWGANGMARSGKTAEQILSHYYSGIRIKQAMKLPNGI